MTRRIPYFVHHVSNYTCDLTTTHSFINSLIFYLSPIVRDNLRLFAIILLFLKFREEENVSYFRTITRVEAGS